MTKTACSLAAIVALAGGITMPAMAADCENLAGEWTNAEDGAPTLVITEVEEISGHLRGQFTSPSGTAGEAFALTGWVVTSKDDRAEDVVPALTFSVRFTPYGSVSAWSGTCRALDGVPTIETIWHLTRSHADYDWSHQLTGTDVFVPVAME
ncbi:autotransporter [Parvularcula flava]|uniref:Autotransporter n=2 Tax=Aquisalinus luteolus TaxID=1566827 RepID=A0ABX0HQA1_9PROT|nr:avidin/streptavidin family protein [Aquisalinus luteolus]NHK28749.1 autotransporter [Aquisalinus luteolus]